MGLLDYSTNPSNNGVVAGLTYWPEGMLPGQVNDTGRQIMADLANWLAAPALSAGLNVAGTVTVGKAITNGANNTVGTASLSSADATHSGYVEFFDKSATRRGYIGYAADGNPLQYNANGSGHAFDSGVTVGGSQVYTTTSLTATSITSALGYTPYNSSNPSGYINNVVNALGYTPASKAGDRFTGDVGRAGSSAGNGFALGLLGSNPMYELNGTDSGIYFDFAAGRIKIRLFGTDIVSIGTDGIRTTGNVAAAQGGV